MAHVVFSQEDKYCINTVYCIWIFTAHTVMYCKIDHLLKKEMYMNRLCSRYNMVFQLVKVK